MTIMITGYGASLHKHGDCIEVRLSDGTRKRFAADQVDALILSVPCSLTSEVITLCMEQDVFVTRTDPFGTPLWRLEPVLGGSTPMIRRRQLLLAERPEGVKLVKSLLVGKIRARSALLRKLASNRRDQRGVRLREAALKLDGSADQISAAEGSSVVLLRPRLQGLEGAAGRVYFSALAELLPKEAAFQGRGRGADAGPFNQMLNYGYGILTQELVRLCAKAKLDPYIGVMHADGYDRPSLVYDLEEPFRAGVEETVFKLFSRRRIQVEQHFTPISQGTQLSGEGKRLLSDAFHSAQEHREKGRSPKMRMRDLVSGLARELGAFGEEEEPVVLVDHV